MAFMRPVLRTMSSAYARMGTSVRHVRSNDAPITSPESPRSCSRKKRNEKIAPVPCAPPRASVHEARQAVGRAAGATRCIVARMLGRPGGAGAAGGRLELSRTWPMTRRARKKKKVTRSRKMMPATARMEPVRLGACTVIGQMMMSDAAMSDAWMSTAAGRPYVATAQPATGAPTQPHPIAPHRRCFPYSPGSHSSSRTVASIDGSTAQPKTSERRRTTTRRTWFWSSKRSPRRSSTAQTMLMSSTAFCAPKRSAMYPQAGIETIPIKGRTAATVPITMAESPASRRIRYAKGKKNEFAMYTLDARRLGQPGAHTAQGLRRQDLHRARQLPQPQTLPGQGGMTDQKSMILAGTSRRFMCKSTPHRASRCIGMPTRFPSLPAV